MPDTTSPAIRTASLIGLAARLEREAHQHHNDVRRHLDGAAAETSELLDQLDHLGRQLGRLTGLLDQLTAERAAADTEWQQLIHATEAPVETPPARTRQIIDRILLAAAAARCRLIGWHTPDGPLPWCRWCGTDLPGGQS